MHSSRIWRMGRAQSWREKAMGGEKVTVRCPIHLNQLFGMYYFRQSYRDRCKHYAPIGQSLSSGGTPLTHR